MSENYFAELAKVNVSAHVEKKGQFSYLSWPFAVQELGKIDPTATWEVRRFDGMPYCKTDCGYFVEVAVTCKGVTKSQIHPILNGANKPIPSPTAFDVNTSIQRCLVKAIALHGLGLYIYAGEDLPESDKPEVEKQEATVTPMQSAKSVGKANFDNLPAERQQALVELHTEVMAELDTKTANHAYDLYRQIVDGLPSVEEQTAFRSLFNSQVRTAFTKIFNQRKEAA